MENHLTISYMAQVGDIVRCTEYSGPDDYYTIGKLYTVTEHRGVVTIRNNYGCRSFEDQASFILIEAKTS